jgi:hypothetical protein
LSGWMTNANRCNVAPKVPYVAKLLGVEGDHVWLPVQLIENGKIVAFTQSYLWK